MSIKHELGIMIFYNLFSLHFNSETCQLYKEKKFLSETFFFLPQFYVYKIISVGKDILDYAYVIFLLTGHVHAMDILG